jgi:hypothetical protein
LNTLQYPKYTIARAKTIPCNPTAGSGVTM